MTNRREKILVALIAVLATLYGFRFLGNRLIFEPIRIQRLQSAQMQREIRLKTRQLDSLRNAELQLTQWRKGSLPLEVAQAQTQYEDYLFDLVQLNGVRNWVVEPGNVFEEEHMTRFPFRVTGQITLENLTGMLYQIYQTQLLHRVRRLDLQRINESDQDIRMVLSIEGIAIDGAEKRTKLVPDEPADELADGGPLDDIPPQNFAIIAERDIFTPLRKPPRLPAIRVAPQDAIDDASFIHLTGTPYWGEAREAWLHDRRTNASWVLQDGQAFELGGVTGTLSGIRNAHIEIVIDGRRWSLGLNRNLRELMEMD